MSSIFIGILPISPARGADIATDAKLVASSRPAILDASQMLQQIA
jgi:hypothetical protein